MAVTEGPPPLCHLPSAMLCYQQQKFQAPNLPRIIHTSAGTGRSTDAQQGRARARAVASLSLSAATCFAAGRPISCLYGADAALGACQPAAAIALPPTSGIQDRRPCRVCDCVMRSCNRPFKTKLVGY